MWYFKGHLSNKKVGVIDTSYTEYSASKLVKLTPDMWSTKWELKHLIGVVLDFREKTITINSIL